MRYVKAESVEEAANAALKLVIEDPHLAEIVKAEWSGELRVVVDEVAEIESWPGTHGGGYTFYMEEGASS